MLDIEGAELTLAYQEAAADVPEDLDQLWWEAWETVVKDIKAFQDLDFEGKRKLLTTLVDEIVIDPEAGTLYLHGTLERVVQFNIERPRPDCDGSRGNGWARPFTDDFAVVGNQRFDLIAMGDVRLIPVSSMGFTPGRAYTRAGRLFTVCQPLNRDHISWQSLDCR